MQLRHALVIKRYLSTDQDIKDNTKTPNINFGSRILSGLKQFRSCKIQTTTESLQEAPWGEQVAETEINDFDVTSLADKDVLDLQIAMYDAVAVAVVQCAGNLPCELARLFFLQLAVGDDVIQHLTAVDIFEQHIPVV